MKKTALLILALCFMALTSSVAQTQETITINPGWNWVAYTYWEPMEIDHAFSPINPTVGDVVKSLNSGFAVYTENGWSGSLTEIYGRHPFHYYSCKQTTVAFDFPDFALPTVATAEVSDLGLEIGTAHGGGEVLANGGGRITARGVCWSFLSQPTIADSHTTDGTGTGSFTSTLTGLAPGTTYYVRAYATNSAGTAYGNVESFTTQNDGDIPYGAIGGLFSVNDNTQVYFSKGNLQYIGSDETPYWKFAEHQWDFLGDNGQGSTAQDVDRDLFGWGTSGYNHGANCYQPWSTSPTGNDYYAYGNQSYNLYDQTGQADWGYNPITNGGNQAGRWRTLTADEWTYVLTNRSTTSGIRFAKARVNNTNGLIIVPDNWSSDTYTLNSTNVDDASYTTNGITQSTWENTLEPAGCVFLPAVGSRDGTSIQVVGSSGYYWTSSHGGTSSAYYIFFNDRRLNAYTYGSGDYGRAVRLVQDCE